MQTYARPLFLLCLFLITLVKVNAATYLSIEGPVNATLHNNDSLYIGKVGPGESFYILANASTISPTGNYVNIGWDTLETVALPTGWFSQPSPLYENPMKLKITISPNAKSGVYPVILRAVNVGNLSKLGNLTSQIYVNVTPNVVNLRVSPSLIESGPGQPANLYIEINNTGISDDPFIITASGLPAWNVTYEFISLHSARNTFIYPVFEDVPHMYLFNLTLNPATSPQIRRTYTVKFIVKESLPNDYIAVSHGIILSPMIYEPAYAVISIITNLYKLLIH